MSYGISFALWPLYVSSNLILNSLFTLFTSSSSCSSRRAVFVAGVSDLALPDMLPEGLGALGCGLDPDIVASFLFILGPSGFQGAQSVTLLLRTLVI
jgi:hypothetical protein